MTHAWLTRPFCSAAVVLVTSVPGWCADLAPLTVSDLEAIGRACLGGQKAKVDSTTQQFEARLAISEGAVIAYLKDHMYPPPDTSSVRSSSYGGFVNKLIESLGRSSNPAAKELLLGSLAKPEAFQQHRWGSLGRALVVISDRLDVNDSDLRLLLQSQDPDIAAFGRRLLDLIRYENVDPAGEELRSTLDNYGRGGAGRLWAIPTDAALKGLLWMRPAYTKALGMQNDQAKALRALIDDCLARQDKYSRLDPEACGLDKADWGYLQAAQTDAAILALDTLVDETGLQCFDDLVNLLERPNNQWLRYPAAYHLYHLTGQYFPINGFLSYKKWGSGAADLSFKAAWAWRKWKAENSDRLAASTLPAGVAVEDRLSAFRMTSRLQPARGQEFERPVDEVIDELLTTTDRRVLDMLGQVLAQKTLDEPRINRIIRTAQTETSEPRLLVLWRVLFDSQSPAGLKVLEAALLSGDNESSTLAFLQTIKTAGSAHIPLLSRIYDQHPSPLVQDAVVQLAVARPYGDRVKIEEPAQELLMLWIIRQAKNDDHKLDALRASTGRAGANAWGMRIIDEMLDSDASPRVRKALYAIAIRRAEATYLRRMLTTEKDEEVMLAGLSALEDSLREGTDRLSRWQEGIVGRLREAASMDLPPRVQEILEGMLATLRKHAIAETLREHESWLQWARSAALRPNELRPYLEARFKTLESHNPVDVTISRLKQMFGDLPEEADLRKRLDESYRQQIEMMKQQLSEESPQKQGSNPAR